MHLGRGKIATWLRSYRGAVAVALALAMVWLAFFSREPPLSATLTWYGVYAAAEDRVVRDDSSWTGDRIVSTGITPPQVDGDRISIVAGERFGFGFALSGPPEGTIVHLRWVRLFPPPGVPVSGVGERRNREEQDLAFAIGQKDLFLGYRIDRSEDNLPGTWTFQLWDGDRRLLEKSFLLAAPANPQP
jgi:hypothetical protein